MKVHWHKSGKAYFHFHNLTGWIIKAYIYRSKMTFWRPTISILITFGRHQYMIYFNCGSSSVWSPCRVKSLFHIHVSYSMSKRAIIMATCENSTMRKMVDSWAHVEDSPIRRKCGKVTRLTAFANLFCLTVPRRVRWMPRIFSRIWLQATYSLAKRASQIWLRILSVH